jgi:hypothetical protein
MTSEGFSDLVCATYRPRVLELIQGYSKRSINFQKLILHVLLGIWRRAIYRLKGELSKLFSHLTSARRGRCQIDNPALPTLVAACHR